METTVTYGKHWKMSFNVTMQIVFRSYCRLFITSATTGLENTPTMFLCALLWWWLLGWWECSHDTLSTSCAAGMIEYTFVRYFGMFLCSIKTFIVQYGNSRWVPTTKMMFTRKRGVCFCYWIWLSRKVHQFWIPNCKKQQICILIITVLERNIYNITLVPKYELVFKAILSQ